MVATIVGADTPLENRIAMGPHGDSTTLSTQGAKVAYS